MGAAYDDKGNVLGSAVGDSFREVLDKLELAHPKAAEFRLKDLSKQAAEGYSPTPERMMQFFAYAHLPTHLQSVSKPFGELAETIVATVPSNPERTVALRKLLEAKDCAVRALLYQG
jgi:hypothetical protein